VQGWLLSIVRNTAYNWAEKHSNDWKVISFNETIHAENETSVCHHPPFKAG